MFEVVRKALAVTESATAPELSTRENCARRAEDLFREQQQEIYRNTDELFARLMVVQWIACIIMAVVISPYTWAGEERAIHTHVWAAIFLGGIISAFPIWLTRFLPGAVITRYVIAVAQMLMSALLISVTGGRIETHFHVFGSLVILSFYRDWRVLVPATVVVGLDHFLRGIYWPYSVYGVLAASPWRSMEHAGWVVFEDFFLVISCLRSIREMRSIANRTAALEASEQTFRQIFQDGPMGIALVDLEQRFVKVNESLCHMMGYSAQELIGLNTLDLTVAEDTHRDHQVVAELSKGSTRSAFEKRYRRKNGEVLWVNLTAAVVRDEKGQPNHYITMMKDITARKMAEDQLLQMNVTLEQRVAERTSELQREITERVRAEQSLLASEERYRTLFERNPEPMWVFDCETLAFLEVNRAAIAHYGYSHEEFLRMTLRDIRPREDVGALVDNIKSLPEGETATSQWKHRKKDGTLIDVSITANEFVWNDRAARLVVAIDVTERKRAQDALNETNLALTNAMPGISILTPDGRYERMNEAYAEMMGYRSAELVGMDWMPTVAEKDRQGAMNAYKQMLAAGKSEFEACAIRKDGSVFDKHVLMVKRVDADGTLLGHYCFMRDITEHKRAQEALLHAEQKYRAIVENAVEGIFQTTPDGEFVSANPALARICGYDSPEDLATHAKNIANDVYVDPAQREEFKQRIEAYGFVERFEYEIYRKDRTKIWISESARVVRDAAGKVLYYEGTVEDITYRKRVEEVERANKAKSEFLSRVSHELRTPLNAILGFGQLLERQKPTEVQRKRIRHILNAGQHLLGLINEVLDISRIEAGKMQVSLEAVCVADAIAEAIDLMRPLAFDRAIQLSAETNLDASIYVLADRQRFKQVLLNLLTNAVKYTQRDGRVTVSYHTSGSENIRICVADNGPGISSEKLSRLFIPFERLGAEQSNVEGTGLGLALSKRLTDAMHGSMGVESTPGQGSNFWVELPRTASPLEQVASKRAEAVVPIQPENPARTILYIEDNLPNLTLIEQVLEERPGLKLISAMQGNLGLQLARQHLPDVIMLDLHLPDVPGWDVLAELKREPATREIPVIVISADATPRQIQKLLKAGAKNYLTKPLNIPQFFETLDEVASNGANNGNGASTPIAQNSPELSEVPS
ncbi:MAG TPA: PAS domain S-box protein [Chthoniobacterales bacterium]|jgi:PAS domain S-box-containing protein|nr:PAS domain S-box protein [Chthoniobacterales bacterium]